VGAGAWVVVGAPGAGASPADPARLARSLLELLAERRAGCVVFDRQALGASLDPFVMAAAVADDTARTQSAALGVGAYVELGAGRTASVAMRELTCLDHLAPGRGALVLAGRGARLAEAGAVARAMLSGEPSTAGGQYEWIDEAPNRPPPPTDLRPRIVLLDLDQLQAVSLAGETFRVRSASSLAHLAQPAVDELVLATFPEQRAPAAR
jgi:alkanesulfonate monooxygenase SsuD/methylene tetrahydromethanopterin reductase-like flavin-dependent oxidoreductase (luciferase family)